ncbi:hypothetical protein E4634_00670 [Mangrovimicrobium sediminis]|uniref:Exo-alpha-sialidase n=1 Tax=Mangrovimicrobium sediminis TaxID=2562682 RepID=A0A4Z0M9M6_9GAMM|nr:hypothetical protein [Haliea sp. SAOS-164]TGD76096.1 hypothetical protein E4634_00670 [Haliea sp. SAOS-164]
MSADVQTAGAGMPAESGFRPIGQEGMGNPRSKVAHCLAWFKGYVYLGVTHHKGMGAHDRARILRWDPASGNWETVYESPLVEADERANPQDVLRKGQMSGGGRGRKAREEVEPMVPLYRGFRSMLVYQGPSDDEPALYISSICHWGARILRTQDGVTFTELSDPGLVDESFLSFRSLTNFNGKVFCAPTGAVRDGYMDRNFAGDTIIFVTDDPTSNAWVPAMEPGFGDDTNSSISRLVVFNGFLYASAGNPRKGFQLYKTDASGEPPYTWTPVLTDGAQRYNLNETAPTMIPFKGALYIGSGLPGMGKDSANDVGPAAFELIRLNADDSWDLIAGEPRFTLDGLKVPFSCMGPGFDDFYNSVIWAMEVHDGYLYAGTHHWLIFQAKLRRQPEVGGFHLWRSSDGDNWEAVTLDGFGYPYEVGIRTLLSTPEGLVLGTSNHMEASQFGMRRDPSEGEPAGSGCQVWLGQDL